MITINPLSTTSLYTEIFYQEYKLGTATTFVYKYNDEKYLITNYHVAYGINPENKVILNENGMVPNKLIIHYYNQNLELKDISINYQDDINPFHFIKINEQIVDIAVFKLHNFDGFCINELYIFKEFLQEENNVNLSVTETLFVLGYPRGINIQKTPIWKKSSIASEPEFNVNNLPYFYIDTTTREGMSGSPVCFYSQEGNYSLKNGGQVLASGPTYCFVGVYSGRDINDEPHIAQLGKVWKKSIIENIIENTRLK